MESTSARDIDRRLAELVRSERHLVVQFVVELAGFAKRELYRDLGYPSLFYYCVRQLGLSKSSAFRRSETPRLIARFPVIADRLADGRLSIRALVELREVSRSPWFPRELKRLLRHPRSSSRSRLTCAASTSRSRQTSWPSWSKCVPRSLTSAPPGTSNRLCVRPSSWSSSEIASARR